MTEKSKPLQIYMKPAVKEDALLLRVWESCKRHDRPQDVFRTLLRLGLLAAVETGEMPEAVIEECSLENLLERRRRRTRKAAEAPAVHAMMPYPYYPYPPHQQAPVPMTVQPSPMQSEMRIPETPRQPAPVETPEPERKAVDTPGTVAATPPKAAAPESEPRKGRIGNLM